jgi:L-ribulokinase
MKSNARSRRYVLGIDFGTLSGRTLLVSVETGEEVASSVHHYADGVIDAKLGSKQLPHATALQNPRDYLEVLYRTIPALLRQTRVRGEQVIGIGVDFTSCTMLPTTQDGTPLCLQRRWQSKPHAWVKLWKHHAAQPEADAINELGRRRNEKFLQVYGGKYSSEWFFSKVLETLRHAPDVYAAADRFIEAGDWLVWQLTGREARCESAAGFKAMRVYSDGRGSWTYPSPAFFRSLHPKLSNVVAQKLDAPVIPLGSTAGGLTPDMARRTGLRAGTPVAAANIDAHAAVPACGVTTPGQLVMIVGTSTCHLLVDSKCHQVEGLCGVVQDGVIPGYWGYEAGQAGVGDLFDWFIRHGLPARNHAESRRTKLSPYAWLDAQAARLRPGQSGLVALDWWNGCRSVLMDSNLSGCLFGLTLATTPEQIYRALIEATAFGTRNIIETFARQNVRIRELYACGGLAKKSPFLMQTYSDVTGKPIRVAASDQASALGAALFAAVAAKAYPDIQSTARKMVPPPAQVYRPSMSAHKIYNQLYQEYQKLHDLLGRDTKSSLKVLHQLRTGERRR